MAYLSGVVSAADEELREWRDNYWWEEEDAEEGFDPPPPVWCRKESTTDELASTTPAEFLSVDTASSTATSIVPEPLPEEPKEEPFVLQPAVTLDISGNSITAAIELENLTCKSCEKVPPAAQVKVYYTAWYPNDGPDLKEVGERFAEQEISVSDIALWASRSMAWSAADVPKGRYYFVVVVDPENAIGAYRMHRSEFSI